jgi:Icc-related predicted phosphoesterase/uncharacterized protein YprB with RNaseH-like and TPR domain
MKSKKHSHPRRLTGRKSPRSIKAVDLGAHSGPLRLVAFSDYRVHDIELLIEELSKLQPPPDIILYAGDDIGRFHEPGGKNLFEAIASFARFGLCAVAGNDEDPSVRQLISGKTVLDVHLCPVRLGDYAILGIDGVPKRLDARPWGYISHPEQQIAKHLTSQLRATAPKRAIVVSHAPPRGILDQALRYSVNGEPRSIGSSALKEFIRVHNNVALVVSGHVHLCGGRDERFSGTTVVNAANHDRSDTVPHIAIIELPESGLPKIEWRRIRPLSGVPGIGQESVKCLREAGIRTIEQLASAPYEILRTVLRFGHPPELVQARARAIVQRRAIFLRSLEWIGNDGVFLDIETDLRGRYVWLIGVSAGRQGGYRSFFAQSPSDEKRILEDFLNFMKRYPNEKILTYSNCRFEERMFRKRLTFHGLPADLCDRIVDLYAMISRAVALPIDSTGVKDVGSFFGYHYKHPSLDGLRVAALYTGKYQRVRHGSKRRKLERTLLEYNEDDVRCLPFILDAIENQWKKENSSRSALDL